ncbi:MAG: AsmA-like C-terminal region-containing protein, partial [Pseudomonadota bacterium]
PAASVKMSGDISLPTENVNLSLSVAPKISGVAAVGTGFLVNPLVGLGVLLGGGLITAPIEKILSVQYTVTGTWDNPLIERTGKTVAPAAISAPVLPVAPSAASPKMADENVRKKSL